MERIEIRQGDITQLRVDAIVNAANQSLLGGKGVDGAIHEAAGDELLEACHQLGGCKTGQAKITLGYRLPVNFVIHTVGPVWQGGHANEQVELADCYRQSLRLAQDYDIRTIAFPAISCGAYRFPWPLAAEIAVREVRTFLETAPLPEKVIFCCLTVNMMELYLEEIVK